MLEDHAALEYIGVLARVFLRRVGARKTQQLSQLTDKALRVGELGAGGVLPAGEEYLSIHRSNFIPAIQYIDHPTKDPS